MLSFFLHCPPYNFVRRYSFFRCCFIDELSSKLQYQENQITWLGAHLCLLPWFRYRYKFCLRFSCAIHSLIGYSGYL